MDFFIKEKKEIRDYRGQNQDKNSFHFLSFIFNFQRSIDKNAQHKPLNLISITRSSNNNISIFVRST